MSSSFDRLIDTKYFVMKQNASVHNPNIDNIDNMDDDIDIEKLFEFAEIYGIYSNKSQLVQKFKFSTSAFDNEDVYEVKFQYLSHMICENALPYKNLNFEMFNFNYYKKILKENSKLMFKKYCNDLQFSEWKLHNMPVFLNNKQAVKKQIESELLYIMSIEETLNVKFIVKKEKRIHDYYNDLVHYFVQHAACIPSITDCNIKALLIDCITKYNNEYELFKSTLKIEQQNDKTQFDAFYSSVVHCFCFIILNHTESLRYSIQICNEGSTKNKIILNNIEITNVSFIILYIDLKEKNIIYACKYKHVSDDESASHKILYNLIKFDSDTNDVCLLKIGESIPKDSMLRESIHKLFMDKFGHFISTCDVFCISRRSDCQHSEQVGENSPFVINTMFETNKIGPFYYCLSTKIINYNKFDLLLHVLITISKDLFKDNNFNFTTANSVTVDKSILELKDSFINRTQTFISKMDYYNLMNLLESVVRCLSIMEATYMTMKHVKTTKMNIEFNMSDVLECINDKYQQTTYLIKDTNINTLISNFVQCFVNTNWVVNDNKLMKISNCINEIEHEEASLILKVKRQKMN